MTERVRPKKLSIEYLLSLFDRRCLPEHQKIPQNTSKHHKRHPNAREITRRYSRTPQNTIKTTKHRKHYHIHVTRRQIAKITAKQYRTPQNTVFITKV